jgi:ADP-heptose:LPS heptosyltransferase
MFRAVREKYPDAEIHVLAGKHNFFVINNNPRIDKIYIHKKNPFNIIKNILALKKEKYDYWLDAKDHYSNESKIFAKWSNAITKVGFNRSGKKVFDISIPSNDENKNLHFVQRLFNALIPLGIKCPEETPKPELFVSPDSENYVNVYFETLPLKPIILINISSGSPDRMWENENWSKVIEVIDEEKYNIILLDSGTDEALIQDLSAKTNKMKIFKSRSITDAFSIIKRAKLLLTVDTSIVHIASAFNIPQIALYVNLEEFYKKFHPLSDVDKPILSEKGGNSIKNIKADEVISALKNMFS